MIKYYAMYGMEKNEATTITVFITYYFNLIFQVTKIVVIELIESWPQRTKVFDPN